MLDYWRVDTAPDIYIYIALDSQQPPKKGRKQYTKMMIVYCSILFGGYYNEPLNHLLNGGSKGPTLQLEEPLSEQWAGTEIDIEYLHVAAGHITHHSP